MKDINIQTFKPYKLDLGQGKIIEVTSRKQRDKILKEKNLTYDNYSKNYLEQRKRMLVEDNRNKLKKTIQDVAKEVFR